MIVPHVERTRVSSSAIPSALVKPAARSSRLPARMISTTFAQRCARASNRPEVGCPGFRKTPMSHVYFRCKFGLASKHPPC